MNTEPTQHPLARYRAEAGLSQEALGTEVGCKRWMINRIENGHRAPSNALLRRIARATGLTPNEILNMEPAE